MFSGEIHMKKFVQCVQSENKNYTFEETINSIKKAGFDSAFVQWYNRNWSMSQQEQFDLCKKLGLDVPFFHLGYDGINKIWLEGEDGDKLVENYINDLNSCNKLGVDLVVMHLSAHVAPAFSEIGIERFRKIIEHADKLGIRVAIENTRPTEQFEKIFELIPNKNLGLCFDAGHYNAYFNRKFDFTKFKDKIFAVHLHDNNGLADQHLNPFDGEMDWKFVMGKLKESNYNGPIVLESCYRYDYLKMTLDEFYKQSYDRAQQLADIV